MAEQKIHLICAECGTFSEGPGGRLAGVYGRRLDDEEDPDAFVVSFCSECAEREFS